MSRPLNILIAEDSADDALLIQHVLKRAGLDSAYLVVQDAAAMAAALDRQAWDAIVSDFNMPGFTGLDALKAVRNRGLDIPFILISGSVGEEIAVDAMKAGANDFIMKVNLSRLGSVLGREIRDAAVRVQHRVAQRQLTESEAGLRRAQAMAGLAHVVTGADGIFESWSESLPRMIGVEPGLVPPSVREWIKRIHPDDRDAFRSKSIQAARREARTSTEYRIRHSSGALLHICHVMEPINQETPERIGARWFNTLQDITERRAAEETLRMSEERHRAMFEQAAVGIVHSALDGEIQLVNEKFAEMSGYSCEEASGLSIRDLADPVDAKATLQQWASMLTSESKPYERELQLVRKDGSHIWVHVATSLVRGSGGDPSNFISVVSDISERQRAALELQRFRKAMDVSSDSIYITDPITMQFIYSNNQASRRLGYSQEQLLRMGPVDLFPAERDTIGAEYAAVLAAGESGFSLERRFTKNDGSERWTEIHRCAVQTAEGPLIVTMGRDITQRKMHEERIERLNRVQAMLSGINAAIIRIRDRDELFREACRIAVDAGKFTTIWIGMVDRAERLVTPVAWRAPEAAIKQLLQIPMRLDAGENEPMAIVAQAIATKLPVIVNNVQRDPRIHHKATMESIGIRSVALLPLIVDCEAVGVYALHSPHTDFFDESEVRLLSELAGDISFALDHMEKASKLDYLAFYDSLTGLANRSLFNERLTQLAHSAGPAGEKFALVIADVERLRAVNDSLGRQAGDALLKELAARLAGGADPAELARTGADKFAIVLHSIKGKSDASRRIERMWRICLAEPFMLEGTEVRIAVKSGVARFPNEATDAEGLLRNAELALREGKANGERVTFYAAQMTQQSAAQLSLETRLRQALELDQFVLHYQPKVDLESRTMVGAEALIRWKSPSDGLVPPAMFIPLLEKTGLILEVGAWALRRAVADYGELLRQGLSPPRIAVNVSPIQLRQRDFVETVRAVIGDSACAPGIDLEITESLMMEDVEGNIGKLKAVRDFGLAIAIDDFGTGYSSLAYLAKLPVNSLKIDRSFITTMLKDPDTMALVQMIVSLAHSLRLTVVAEGVEETEEANMLRLLRCNEAQGYLFSRPVPFAEFVDLVKSSVTY